MKQRDNRVILNEVKDLGATLKPQRSTPRRSAAGEILRLRAQNDTVFALLFLT
jgi:hypothetical protein